MFRTIKLNKEYWKKKFPSIKYGVPNPLNVFSTDADKFSDAMTSFTFSGVFKTTKAERHIKTNLFLKTFIDKLTVPPVILDIGASDGSTSLFLMNRLDYSFKKYYVTDYNIKCSYYSRNGYTYFFTNKRECFLVASEKFVFYPAHKWLFDLIFNKSIKEIQHLARKELLLINKDLQQKQATDNRIEIIEHNIFEPWSHQKADIIVVGNLLNSAYFTNVQIESAIKICYEALTDFGLLTIIRNCSDGNGSEIETSTVYQKNCIEKKFDKIHETNNGIDVDQLIRSLIF